MMMSEKATAQVESCRFCWMCHHICPIGNATGHERSTARARALGVSLVNRGAIELDEIMDNIYECATCGACVHDCITGWDPVMFTKEVRLQAALDGKLPEYINKLVDNCLETGNAYGKTELDGSLSCKIQAHEAATGCLFYLGADARYLLPEQAVKAVTILEQAGVSFTLLAEEPASGVQLDFLIGAAAETKAQMSKAAEVLNGYKTVVVYHPEDAKAIKQLYHEYGVELTCQVLTYTSFLADLLKKGSLKAEKKDLTVVYQDPYQLSRDLGETEEPREIISAYADRKEMLLNRAETVWAGNCLMAEYLPDVIYKVAERRLRDVVSAGASVVVTASVSEYAALKRVKQDRVTVLSIEDLILM